MNAERREIENGPVDPTGGDEPASEELGKDYGGNYLVLMPRDPEWLHAYWAVPKDRVEAAVEELGVARDEARFQLLLHDVTDLIEPKSGRPRLEDSTDPVSIPVEASADHWYIKAGGAGQLYCVEYLVGAADGRVVRLALSNLVATPADEVVAPADETWVTASVEGGKVTKTESPGETKWTEGHEHLHEALSSGGSSEALAGSSEP